MEGRKRLFAGIKIEFSERTKNFFNGAKEILNESEIKWTEAENMHLTLKFLGDVITDMIPKISVKLKMISGKYSELEPLLKGVGVFRDFYHPKILWFGLRNCPELEKMKNDVENTLSGLGFEIDYRKFTPHLTVARFKGPVSSDQLKKFVNTNREVYLQTVKIKDIVLFESILSQAGPTYIEIERYSLGKDDGFREIRF